VSQLARILLPARQASVHVFLHLVCASERGTTKRHVAKAVVAKTHVGLHLLFTALTSQTFHCIHLHPNMMWEHIHGKHLKIIFFSSLWDCALAKVPGQFFLAK